MKEIVCIHVGQAGVQMGNCIWELLCAEHGINDIGVLQETSYDSECLDTFFSLSYANRFVPRSIFVDLEPGVIDEIRSGSYKTLFHPDRLITGPEDAANNFARGFFTVGKLLLGIISHELKKLLESGDSTQAIFIFRSLGGGTGSGLTSAIFDSLADYAKLIKIEMPIYPSPTLSSSMVEPYNCLLGEHFCMEDIDVGLLLDNEALYDICSKYLSISDPTFTAINRLISVLTCSITASVRFENIMNCDISVLQTNLVPYPRIHFPLANFSPILSETKALHEEISVIDMTRAVFEKENQMMKIDHSFGKYMSCSLFYRGEVSPYQVYQALSAIKKDKNVEFVEWCPTGFKVGINVCSPTTIPASGMCQTPKNVTMLANTSAIGQAWQRLTHKFYLLYSKRSFVHWFVGEGMEECEFTESLYNISALVKDYEEVTMDRNNEEDAQTPADDIGGKNVDHSNIAYSDNSKNVDDVDSDDEEQEVRDSVVSDRRFVEERLDDDEVREVSEHSGRENTVIRDIEEGIKLKNGDSTDDENQNFNFLENADVTSENDNTLDNIKTSIVEDEKVMKEFFSSIL